jgi:hypothetical protein
VNVGNVNMVKNIELRYAREVRNNGMYVVNVGKDNVGVVAVLGMHSVNGNKSIELRYAREVRNNMVYAVNVGKDNVGVVAVLAMP